MTQSSAILRAIICEIAAVNFNSVVETPCSSGKPACIILSQTNCEGNGYTDRAEIAAL